MQTIVIAGAGMAGLTTAEALREAGFDGTITLVGDEPHRPYERPPLSKEVLTSQNSGKGVWLRTDDELAALSLDLRLGVRAMALRPSDRAVELSDGTSLVADAVVVATGARARRPRTDLPGVHVLRTLDDAEALRADLLRYGRVAVVGAGFLGAEVAAAPSEQRSPCWKPRTRCCRGSSTPGSARSSRNSTATTGWTCVSECP